MSPRYLVLAVAPLFYGSSGAAEDVAVPPPDAVFAPLPRFSYLRFEPSYTMVADGGSASELHVRAVVVRRWSVPAPGTVQRLWALGADLALRHERTSTSCATGIGDLELTPLAGLSAHVGVIGVGLALALPTATSDVFGTRAVRLGPAFFAQTSALPHMELAVLVRSYAAVAGHADSASSFSTKVEPAVVLTLPHEILLSSDGEIEIDWLAGTCEVPVNLQLSHTLGHHVLVTAGPEVTVAGADRGNLKLDLELDYLFDP